MGTVIQTPRLMSKKRAPALSNRGLTRRQGVRYVEIHD
jgi:hypothetical protein